MFETKNIPARQQASPVQATEMPSREWWKEAIIYQVYPRSFKDSNGDGIGDIPGIISKLDYIKSLGVKAIWLNPVYASPNDDNGYDISDYGAIMKEFGTMEDFDLLLKGLHDRGIKLLMDLVVNHTSDEHEWFKQARSSRDNPYRDFYHWWPKEKGNPPRRMSFFDPKGDAWEFDERTNAYYLHIFSKKQPDLNWDNPRLRQEIYKMMASWFDKGVDGFRMDAISFISKDNSYPVISKREIQEKYHDDWAYYYSSGPHLHEYLQEMNREVLSKYPVVAVAEAPGINQMDALLFVHSDRGELQMMYHFEGMVLGRLTEGFKRPDPAGYKLQDFKRVYSEWDYVFEREGWGTIYLCNHDQPRMVSRWGNDAPEFRVPSAKLLITFLLTMRATPIFYNGDELGMINIKFESIDDYRDIETHTMYSNLLSKNGNLKQFLEDQKASARDNSRTPFQWDATGNAGFTSGTPWIKINPDYLFVNEEAQNADKNSVLNYFRSLADLRNNRQVFIYGHYTLYDDADPQVYAYTRIWGKEGILVVLNFSKEIVQYNIPSPLDIKENPIVNSETVLQLKQRCISLLPYQALVFELAP